jgi:hypothetical protein
MARQEFKTVKLYATQTVREWDAELAYWGNENWELVSVVPHEEHYRALLQRRIIEEVPKQEAWTDKGLT